MGYGRRLGCSSVQPAIRLSTFCLRSRSRKALHTHTPKLRGLDVPCGFFEILAYRYLIGCPSAIINFNMPDNWQHIVSGADFGNHGGGGLSYCTHTSLRGCRYAFLRFMNSDLLNWPTIIKFNKHVIWQTMLDHQVLEKQNVQFQVGISMKTQSNSKWPTIAIIYFNILIYDKLCQKHVAGPLL